jgi:hypothetical protein
VHRGHDLPEYLILNTFSFYFIHFLVKGLSYQMSCDFTEVFVMNKDCSTCYSCSNEKYNRARFIVCRRVYICNQFLSKKSLLSNICFYYLSYLFSGRMSKPNNILAEKTKKPKFIGRNTFQPIVINWS